MKEYFKFDAHQILMSQNSDKKITKMFENFS